MAPRTVVLSEEPLAVIDGRGIVVILRRLRIHRRDAVIKARRKRGGDDCAAVDARGTRDGWLLMRPTASAKQEQDGQRRFNAVAQIHTVCLPPWCISANPS